MKVFAACIALMLVVGCGHKKPARCDLSGLKVKEVTIDGDRNGFVEDAILHELYARGARSSPDGATFTGSAEFQDGRLVALNFSADNGSIAAAASLVDGSKPARAYFGDEKKEDQYFQSSAEAVAKKAVAQVCDCVHGLH